MSARDLARVRKGWRVFLLAHTSSASELGCCLVFFLQSLSLYNVRVCLLSLVVRGSGKLSHVCEEPQQKARCSPLDFFRSWCISSDEKALAR